MIKFEIGKGIVENGVQRNSDFLFIVNFLKAIITDFLVGMKLDNTRSVFTEETGEDSDNKALVDRHRLSREVGIEIADNQGDVPLLLLLIQHLKSLKKGARKV